MKILLLGATGSIGTQTLEVLDQDSKYHLVGISYHHNITLAKKIISKYHLQHSYSKLYPEQSNATSIASLIALTKPDLVVNAIVGFAGLEASLATLEAKCDLALANKETLVVAGHFIMPLAKSNNCTIYPIDSEHAALYELIHYDLDNVKKLYITASGGPFYHASLEQLENVKFKDAIKHPNWSMGYKISIDSATLVNKCFEIIEAYYLFDIKNIEPLYHPQSIVHSMVEYQNGSIAAQLSTIDMKLAIQLALYKFKKQKQIIKSLDFSHLQLQFDKIDLKQFLPLNWAQEIINDPNHSKGAIVTITNDLAIEAFKEAKIKYLDIINIIKSALNLFSHVKINNIDDIYLLANDINSWFILNY